MDNFCHAKAQMKLTQKFIYLTKRLNSDHETYLVVQSNAKLMKQPEPQYAQMIGY